MTRQKLRVYGSYIRNLVNATRLGGWHYSERMLHRRCDESVAKFDNESWLESPSITDVAL